MTGDRAVKRKRKAIFMDRDGVINYDPHDLTNVKDLKLLPDVPSAIKLINSSGYLAIVVTNQSSVARGLLSLEGLEDIHEEIKKRFEQEGARLDAIYFCPHYPKKESEVGIPELEIECACRKPKPGMILKAKEDYNIDLEKSWIIGDTERDILTGRNANLNTILVKKNQDEYEACSFDTKKAEDLYSAVKRILENKKIYQRKRMANEKEIPNEETKK